MFAVAQVMVEGQRGAIGHAAGDKGRVDVTASSLSRPRASGATRVAASATRAGGGSAPAKVRTAS